MKILTNSIGYHQTTRPKELFDAFNGKAEKALMQLLTDETSWKGTATTHKKLLTWGFFWSIVNSYDFSVYHPIICKCIVSCWRSFKDEFPVVEILSLYVKTDSLRQRHCQKQRSNELEISNWHDLKTVSGKRYFEVNFELEVKGSFAAQEYFIEESLANSRGVIMPNTI